MQCRWKKATVLFHLLDLLGHVSWDLELVRNSCSMICAINLERSDAVCHVSRRGPHIAWGVARPCSTQRTLQFFVQFRELLLGLSTLRLLAFLYDLLNISRKILMIELRFRIFLIICSCIFLCYWYFDTSTVRERDRLRWWPPLR